MLKFVKTAALMLKDVKNQHLSLEVSIIFLYLCSEKDLNNPNIHPPLKERSRIKVAPQRENKPKTISKLF
jgi:hypothetical protein